VTIGATGAFLEAVKEFKPGDKAFRLSFFRRLFV